MLDPMLASLRTLPFLLAASLLGPAVYAVQPAAQPATRTLVCLGDSLTAGYGLAPEQAYPARLEARAKAAGLPWRVVNAGISGDTTAGGLRRLDWALKGQVDLLFICLGANDGLRGIPPSETEKNLRLLIQKAKAKGIPVVLAGMKLPDNFGKSHQQAFEALYPRLAKSEGVPLLPFLLEGVAMNPRLNQADGIHPTAEGAAKVTDTVWKVLEPRMRKASR